MTGSDFKNSKWCKEGGTEKGRAKVAKDFKPWTRRVGDCVLLSKARQLYQFFASPNVKGVQKTIVAGALLYLIAPLDLFPDVVPVVGWLDDVGVAVFALNYIFATLGQLESAAGSEVAAPKGFNLSEKQVVEAEIVDESKAREFGTGQEPQDSKNAGN